MAKVDSTDTSFYMNPAAYAQVREDKKTKGVRHDKRFSSIFDDLRGKTADELGPLRNLPASDEAVNALMDEVRNAGDVLQSRPLPEEIMRYKQAVRNFINYVVHNTYELDHDSGRRLDPLSDKRKIYTKIQVIDKKLEDLAAMLLSGQKKQMELLSRLEEIRGLLVDLLH